MPLDEPAHEYISQIFKALSSKERIAALETFGKGKTSLMELARTVGLSRSGFQNILDDFREARLIEQTEHRSYYSLSSKGKKVLDMLNELDRQITPLEKDIKKEQLKASITKFGSGLTQKDIMKLFEELEKETKK